MIVDMIDIDRQLIRSFGSIKLHKKESKKYILFYLRKLYRGKFCSTALVQSNI